MQPGGQRAWVGTRWRSGQSAVSRAPLRILYCGGVVGRVCVWGAGLGAERVWGKGEGALRDDT